MNSARESAIAIETQDEIGMTLSDFLEETSVHPFDLINGEKKPHMPTVAGQSITIRYLFVSLHFYVIEHQIGEVFSETTFIIPDAHNRNCVAGSRTPDVMYYAGQRISAYKA